LKQIEIEIKQTTLSVNNDTPTLYKFNNLLLDKYYKNKLNNAQLAALGKSIFDEIFCTDDRQNLLKLKNNEKLLIIIKSDIPSIHDIPFELLNNPNSSTGFLLKNPLINLIRHSPNTIDIKNPHRPLKMLFILAQPLEIMINYPIDPLREITEIKQAIQKWLNNGQIELYIEEKPSIQRLSNRLKSEYFDIIHYSGHGVKGGYLILEDNEDPTKAYYATPKELGEIFDTAPKLIYLDTCEGARSNFIEPSLAYRLANRLNSVIIANTASISDKAATQSTQTFYQNLDKNLEEAIGKIRIQNIPEWYKTTIFSKANNQLSLNEIPSRKKNHIIQDGFTHLKNDYYIYRYRLVRKASDILEETKAMLIHGIGGSGKSTFAKYLCEFFTHKFNNIIFIDLHLEKIKEVNELLEFIKTQYSLSLDDIISKEKLLLVFDNFEVAQDENGILKPSWRRFIQNLLKYSKNQLFTIFTSRTLIYYNKRDLLIPEKDILNIKEYENADIDLLLHHLNKDKKHKLKQILNPIYEEFGYHPLSLSIALNLNLESNNIKKILEDEELQELMQFYKNRINNTNLLKAFINLPLSLPYNEASEILSVKELKLIKNLAIGWEENGYLKIYPILKHFIDATDEEKEKLFNKLKEQKSQEAKINTLFLAPKKDYLKYLMKALEHENLSTILSKFLDKNLLTEQINLIRDEKKQAGILNNLGVLYKNLGEFEKAKEFYLKALEIRNKLANLNNAFLPDLASTQNNLGDLYSNLGEFEKAKEFYLKALEIRNKTYDDNHLTTLTSYLIILAKLNNLNELSKYICKYFELTELLGNKNKLEFFWLKENAPLIDVNNLNIKYITCKEKVKNFFNTIQFLKSKKEL